MKKILFGACFALCLGIQGMASTTYISVVIATGEALHVEAILEAASAQCEYSHACLSAMYVEGAVFIDKNAEGDYVVTIESAGGGNMAIILVDDAL